MVIASAAFCCKVSVAQQHGSEIQKKICTKQNQTDCDYLAWKKYEWEHDMGLQNKVTSSLCCKSTEKGGMGTSLKGSRQINKRCIPVKSSRQYLTPCNHPSWQQMFFSGTLPGNRSQYLHKFWHGMWTGITALNKMIYLSLLWDGCFTGNLLLFTLTFFSWLS